MGADATPASEVTLESWANFIVSLAPADSPCVLVGHSLGGAVISRVAELIPERIRTLVYVSAYLLPAGATVAESARGDAESLIAPNMVPVLRGVTCALRDEVVGDTFFGACTREDREFAVERISPQPLKPLVTPLEVSTARFGTVPRAYVETMRDRAVSLSAQRRMLAKLPCAPVFTLDSDHSPFLSQPEALARILISI